MLDLPLYIDSLPKAWRKTVWVALGGITLALHLAVIAGMVSLI